MYMAHYYSVTNKISSALLSLAWLATSHFFHLVKYYWAHTFNIIWCVHTHSHILCTVKSLITSTLQFLNGYIRRINSLHFLHWNIWTWFSKKKKSKCCRKSYNDKKICCLIFPNQVFSRGKTVFAKNII